MTTQQKISAFEQLGVILKQAGQAKKSVPDNQYATKLFEMARTAHIYNGWFTEENILDENLSNLDELLIFDVASPEGK